MQVFWNFLLCVRQERNETIIFIFSRSHLLSTYFGSKWSHNDIFLIFFEFFCFFLGILYYALGRNETERQDLFSFFLGLFQPILALNEAVIVFFNFFAIFLELSIMRQVGTERNDNFYFHCFLAFSKLFWLQMMQ